MTLDSSSAPTHRSTSGTTAFVEPTLASLDERWTAFSASARPLFSEYPQLEPLRRFVFKELLIGRQSLGWPDRAKRLARPILRRSCTELRVAECEVLFCSESRRNSLSSIIVPLHTELRSEGIASHVLSIAGSTEVPAAERSEFRFPERVSPPKWCRVAWAKLSALVPELSNSRRQEAFLAACASEQAAWEETLRILTVLKPRVVVSAGSNIPGGGRLTLAARSLGIETVLLQHGVVEPFYLPLLADHTVAWGQWSADALSEMGADGNLVVLGSPRHDRVGPGSPGSARKKLQAALGILDLPTLVFFSNGNDLVRNGHAPVECAAWLENAAERFKGRANVVVRLHPNEDGSLYASSRAIVLDRGQLELSTVLDGCDVVSSLCSTVLYESALFAKPIWQFFEDGWPPLSDNWKRGQAQRIATSSELCQNLESFLESPEAFPIVDNKSGYAFANHGRAIEAVAAFIRDLSCRRGEGC